MNFTPTAEQAAALEAFTSGHHLVIQAGAGTGKTSTLAFLAEQNPTRRGRYLAFNRAIAQDAAARFPSTVQCKTAHSLAYAALGHRYRDRLNSPRRPGWKTGADFGLNTPVRIQGRDLLPATLSNTVLRTVTRYCQSADTELAHHHVPHLRGIETEAAHAELADLLLPYAAKAWQDLQDPAAGTVRFEHDHYFKMWALTEPVLEADFLLLDEAQDTNPVLEQIVLAQRERTQIVMVGDSAQAIYGWRGARDVMTGFTGNHLTLTRSFRFGPQLAAEANRWLTLADAPIRLTGSTDLPTTIGPSTDRTGAVLCRTNIGAVTEILALQQAGTLPRPSEQPTSSNSIAAPRDSRTPRPEAGRSLRLPTRRPHARRGDPHPPQRAVYHPHHQPVIRCQRATDPRPSTSTPSCSPSAYTTLELVDALSSLLGQHPGRVAKAAIIVPEPYDPDDDAPPAAPLPSCGASQQPFGHTTPAVFDKACHAPAASPAPSVPPELQQSGCPAVTV